MTRMRLAGSSLIYHCVILLQVVLEVCTTCPKNALNKFQVCTLKVLPDFSQNSLSQGPVSYTEQVKDASDSCRDSRLDDVTHCITNILDRCDGDTPDENRLRRLVDKERTLRTVDYFCKNLRVYEKNAECIFQNHEQVKTCSIKAMHTFRQKVKAKASFEDMLTESCRFHSVARSCLTETTEERCGYKAADFVFQLLTGSIPPHCNSETMVNDNPNYTPYNGNESENNGHNDATAVFKSNKLTVLLFCVAVVLKSIR